MSQIPFEFQTVVFGLEQLCAVPTAPTILNSYWSIVFIIELVYELFITGRNIFVRCAARIVKIKTGQNHWTKSPESSFFVPGC